MTLDHGVATPAGWDERGRCGYRSPDKANEAHLKAYVEVFEASTQPDGCNAHIGPTKVLSARIIKQSTGQVVAVYSPESR